MSRLFIFSYYYFIQKRYYHVNACFHSINKDIVTLKDPFTEELPQYIHINQNEFFVRRLVVPYTVFTLWCFLPSFPPLF